MNKHEKSYRKNKLSIGENTLNIAMIMKGSTLEGPGIRDVIWLQGCSIRCPGCANVSYQPFLIKHLIEVPVLTRYFEARSRYIDGISILGGEPTDQAPALLKLLKNIKSIGLSTVLFTGKLFESLKRDTLLSPLLSYTDLLIDGPFIESKKKDFLYWRGSTNQRFIRLTSYFKDADLANKGNNAEVIIQKNQIIFHGVGAASVGNKFK